MHSPSAAAADLTSDALTLSSSSWPGPWCTLRQQQQLTWPLMHSPSAAAADLAPWCTLRQQQLTWPLMHLPSAAADLASDALTLNSSCWPVPWCTHRHQQQLTWPLMHSPSTAAADLAVPWCTHHQQQQQKLNHFYFVAKNHQDGDLNISFKTFDKIRSRLFINIII